MSNEMRKRSKKDRIRYELRWEQWASFIILLFISVLPLVFKEALVSYVEGYLDAGTIDKRDILSPEDWNQLRTISDHLVIFEGATLHLQGDRTTLERVSESLEAIHEWLQEALVSYVIRFKLVCNELSTSLRIIQKKVHVSSYYTAARLLSLTIRTTFFKDKEGQFKKEESERENLSPFQLILQKHHDNQRPQSQVEFDTYCDETPSYEVKVSPIEWWT
ncbi:hypothetical protein K402DRAFT_440179 [Aulographum hederae CBS 113979]|uniref:Uncharacterized protein n=1 Tax=Aulographum hederae CBS 113979 TaxID=1176131 RepID=A0A6G1GLB7_9PEZI|nr:hypothetical protein K402DRAFT_440179 [Aulographum hederae CBS 113979]